MEPTTGLLVDSTRLRKKINKLEDRSMNSKTGQTKIQGEKRLLKKNRTSCKNSKTILKL